MFDHFGTMWVDMKSHNKDKEENDAQYFKFQRSLWVDLKSLITGSVQTKSCTFTSFGFKYNFIWFFCSCLVLLRSILLDWRKLLELLDMHENKALSWDDFVKVVRLAHERTLGQPASRNVVPDKPEEEEFFMLTLMSVSRLQYSAINL